MRARRSSSHGLTLLGLIIALALGLIVIAAGMRMFTAYQKGFGRLKSLTVVLQDVRLVADQLGRELRMVGFGVDAGQAILEARADRIVFLGDVEDDVRLRLARAAAAGDTVLYVNLDDREPRIDATDRIFLDGGKRETVRVRQGGAAVDVGPEPDVVYLDAPLAYAHAAGTTSVHTVEQVTYELLPERRMLVRNNVVVSDEVDSLAFRYADLYGRPIAFGRDGALDDYGRGSVTAFSADLRFSDTVTGGRELASRSAAVQVDLRNQGFLHYRNDHCPPGPPTGATIVNDRTCRHFEVRWTPPTRNACDGAAPGDLAGYRIYYGTAPGDYYLPPFTVSDPAAFDAWVADQRLEVGQTYYVAVAAYDTSFNESTKSVETRFTLRDDEGPAAPTGITTEAGTDSITLRWTKSPERDALGYRLYRGLAAGFVPGPDTLVASETALPVETVAYVDSGRESCTEYFYVLSAVDCVREGTRSAVVQGDGAGPAIDWPTLNRTTTTTVETTPTPPGPVAPFSLSPSAGQITVNWVNPADADFKRTIVRYATGGSPGNVQSGTLLVDSEGLPGASGTYVHAGLVDGLRYYYSAFAVDRCGTASVGAFADATPGSFYPMVRVTDPAAGATIVDGRLRIQAQAYDPDERTIGRPPDWAADNGKGIARVSFQVTPTPPSGFPLDDGGVPYCGFGGSSDPCATGDVSLWCEGDYDVSAVATDNESTATASPYTRIRIDSGGLGLDGSYAVNASGSTRNVVRFRTLNDAAVAISPRTVRFTWDVTAARLVSLTTGGVALYNADPAPSASGTTITLPSNFSIASGAANLFELVFRNPYTRTSAAVSAGATAIPVYSSAGFAVGDRVYLAGDAARYGTVRSIAGNTLTLTAGIAVALAQNDFVSKSAAVDNVNMTGATIDAAFTYAKGANGPTCPLSLSLAVAASLVGGQVLQDQPIPDTMPSTTPAALRVANGATVPIHVAVSGLAPSGVASVVAYYRTSATTVASPPASGYGAAPLSYAAARTRYEATLQSGTNIRAWYYVVVTDAYGGTYRYPDTGAYVYDHVADANLVCPTGLRATKVNNNTARLRWDASSNPAVTGYNVYRRRDCGAFARVVSAVTDQDARTAGVQYTDTNPPLSLNGHCHWWYVTAADSLGNESQGCSSFAASAGKDCPASCP
jgi:hypothetical protein